MKVHYIGLALPFLLAACAGQDVSEPAVGMANPASVHCVNVGGRSEIRRGPEGETGYCHLPDGRVVEEWALFRAANPSDGD